ncbi:DEAD/DEAH box helicase [Flavicella sp.]|uniref:DEAD/DEAH box helicase n=1 Tax=Flavicella sp. TaxID=2957742 RepID=UPI00262C7676|nr:DEAD/DEAH box helicase [Flavicella sp.]MDG1804059.1 DEAD/DEAH box helicase [Flavicella sp.]
MSTFKELGLNDEILKALTDLGYETPSEIQEKAVPQVISSTQDLKAFAQTGTGKTAAFSLPVLQQLNANDKSTQAIILSPTRELAVQIGKNIESFSKYMKGVNVLTVYGGANIDEQIRSLRKGVQIVVGTPGRTVDLIKRGRLKLENVQWLILDEADEMLNMGFKDELDQVLEVTPEDKQTLLFSATFPREVESIARNYMDNPVEITAGQKNKGSDNVTNEYYVVTERNRYPALKRICDANPDVYGIVFCRTKRETAQVAENLIQDGYNADALHGDLSQAQRDGVMQKFRNKSLQILVATDVAARGLDVNNLTHVINYKLPDQTEAYTHRSGRTGRAGNKGISIALITNKEVGRLRPIERKINKKFDKKEVPSGEEICKSQLFSLINNVKETEVNHDQIDTYLESIYSSLEGLSREDLIQKFVSVEFNKFLKYYTNSRDLNEAERGRADDRGKSRDDENMTRFFINLGRKDDLNPGKLIGLINEQEITDNVEIGQIEILDTFSFFELDKNFTDETISSFEGAEFSGRSVNVEITQKKKRSGGGGRGRRDRRGGSEERRGRGRRYEGGNRSERREGGRSDRSDSRRRDGGSDRRSSDRRGSDRPDRSDRSDRSSGFGRRRN